MSGCRTIPLRMVDDYVEDFWGHHWAKKFLGVGMAVSCWWILFFFLWGFCSFGFVLCGVWPWVKELAVVWYRLAFRGQFMDELIIFFYLGLLWKWMWVSGLPYVRRPNWIWMEMEIVNEFNVSGFFGNELDPEKNYVEN